MKSATVVLGILMFAGCATVRIEQVSAGHVIVPASEQDSFTVDGLEWTPDDRMITQVEKEIGLLFAYPDSRMRGVLTRDGSLPRAAPFPLSDYYIRYCGISKGSKKLIIGKASHRELADPKFVMRPPVQRQPRLNSSLTFVSAGGGTYFFTVTFDAGTMSLDELSYNAPL